MDLTPYNSSRINQPLFDDIVAVRDRLAAEQEARPAAIPAAPGDLSEAFALLDPDLAYLHKEMKTAAAQLERAIRTGTLCDMAQWRFESAESAYLTRLMEVRKNKKLSEYAQECVNGKDSVIKCRKEMRDLSMQEAMNEAFSLKRRQREEETRRREEEQNRFNWLFYFFLGLWLAQMMETNRRRNLELSRLRNDFSNARTAS